MSTPSPTTDTEAGLCDELAAWCKTQGLPLMSADELILQGLTEAQREYLSDFILRWDALFNRDTGGQT